MPIKVHRSRGGLFLCCHYGLSVSHCVLHGALAGRRFPRLTNRRRTVSLGWPLPFTRQHLCAIATVERPAALMKKALDDLRAALRIAFSARQASEADRELYFEAAVGLGIGAVLSFVALCIGAAVVDAGDPAEQWDTVFSRPNKAFHLLPGFLLVSSLLWVFHGVKKKENLIHWHGTVANLVSFAVIAGYVAAVVHQTGGIKGSVYSTTLTSLGGVSLVAPRSIALKMLLFSITLICSLILIWIESSELPHIALMVAFAFLAYGYTVFVKYFQTTGKSSSVVKQE